MAPPQKSLDELSKSGQRQRRFQEREREAKKKKDDYVIYLETEFDVIVTDNCTLWERNEQLLAENSNLKIENETIHSRLVQTAAESKRAKLEVGELRKEFEHLQEELKKLRLQLDGNDEYFCKRLNKLKRHKKGTLE
uniref:BZIP domain-containing protein n=1 Tax=Steinernema glaseri TaxID=37863 RepID=A0A1I7ZVK6_9BILA